MQQIRTADDIKQLGTILFVAAHPDDESFLAAGILAAAAHNGQQVVCVTATKGEAGSQDLEKWPLQALGGVRERELRTALAELGVHHHTFFAYTDGHCAEASVSAAAHQLEAVIKRYRPDTILTFGPDGLTGHPDHRAVSAWTDAAAPRLDYPLRVYHAVHTHQSYDTVFKKLDAELNIFFNIDRPPLVDEAQCAIAFHLPPAIQAQKRRALEAMPSQTEVMFTQCTAELVTKALEYEYFVDASSCGKP